jgi:Transglutaminase-like superfamily
MPSITVKAYLRLIQFDLCRMRGNFELLYTKVRCFPVNRSRSGSTERICQAIDMACIWYWKQVLCLQRSAATVCLLRSYGIPAELVIGAQQMPFRSHAWVEVKGAIVNDKPYTPEMYAVLDRC